MYYFVEPMSNKRSINTSLKKQFLILCSKDLLEKEQDHRITLATEESIINVCIGAIEPEQKIQMSVKYWRWDKIVTSTSFLG